MGELFSEIYVLGTGGGYGESILLNICDKQWIVIDCCTNPNSGEILPLEVLKKNGVDPDNISHVICTHWHDDHIKGISEVYRMAKNSELVFTRVNDSKKFLQMVALDYQKSEYPATKVSTKEFMECWKIMMNRDKIFLEAHIDRSLISKKVDGIDIHLISLSPSDRSSYEFDKEISLMMHKYLDTNKRIPKVNPNHRSIVLLLKVGEHNAILGSDLEVVNDKEMGWNNILESSQSFKMISDASYLKISHHGSKNGYVEELWNNIMIDDSVATITPWKNGKKYLPEDSMLAKYKTKTNELYLTNSTTVSRKAKKRESEKETSLKKYNSTLSEYRYNFGIIYSRINIKDKTAKWLTEVSGTALKVK